MTRWLLGALARAVPPHLRDAWIEEWEAELAALERREADRSRLGRTRITLRFVLGARAHAAELARMHRRREQGMTMMTTLAGDLRFAIRSFRRTPTFTVVAVLTLALGIGATTAMFSVLDGVVLRPLPYDRPDELVMVGSTSQQVPGLAPVAPADFNDWRERNTTFSRLIAIEGWTLDLTDTDRPTRIASAAVSGGFFEMLGVAPLVGRGITEEDDLPGAEPVVVLSHGLWTRRYGADPATVGSRITTADRTFTVVGVMPAGFVHPEALWSEDVEIWFPTSQSGSDMNSRGRFLQVMGRLAPDATLFQARQEMSAIAAAIAEIYPSNVGRDTLIEPLQRETVGDVGRAIALLMGAVGMLLMIACVNVANLFMARASDRAREMAVRTALGARGARIRGQLLTEGVALSLAGGLAGIALAFLGVSAFRSVNPVGIPRVESVTVDARVLAFAFVVSVLTGIAFALAPAFRMGRSGPLAALRDGARSDRGQGGTRLRHGLVAVEVGMAIVLMVGAGLFVNSFLRLQAVDPGFDAENSVAMAITLNAAYAEREQQVTFFRALTERVESLPGVESAAFTSALPLAGDRYLTGIVLDGREPDPGSPDVAEYSRTSPGYFRTMGIDVVAGRELTALDDADAEDVLLVNEAFVGRYWPGEEAIGNRVGIGRSDPTWYTVVGVTADVNREGLDRPVTPEIFFSPLQLGITNAQVVARTNGSPEGSMDATTTAMRTIVAELDGSLPVEFSTLRAYIEESVNQPQFYTQLFSIFAVVALLLAGVGVYGTMSYTVGQRSRELGIRLALGAEAGQVTGLVAREGLAVAGVGLFVGLLVAASGARLLESFLFGVTARDPLTYAAGSVFLALVALAACWIPARRAGRADPMGALRTE